MKITTPNGYVIEISMDELGSLAPDVAKDIGEAAVSLQQLDLGQNESRIPSSIDKLQLIRDIIERQPEIPNGQKDLYNVLYQADEEGLDYTTLSSRMLRTKRKMSGVLGALGRRINNTPGIEDEPGVAFLLNYKNNAPPKGSWGWGMSQELRQVLENGNYSWFNPKQSQ